MKTLSKSLPRLLCCVALGLMAFPTLGCKTPRGSKAPAPVEYTKKDTLLAHESFELPSKILGETRNIAVYLPPQYKTELQRNFPVLYMPDGGVKEDFPHVSFTINELIQQGSIEPTIVVGVANINRHKDLTSPTQVKKEQEKVPLAGGAQKFHDFFEYELKPAIAQRYRVAKMPSAIVGESLAGRWVVEGWLQHPERHQAWIAIDPSLWWNNKELFTQLAPRLSSPSPRAPSRLYLSGAYKENKGNLPEVQAFAQELQSLGLPPSQLTFERYPNYEHSEIFRRSEASIYPQILGSKTP